MKTKITITLAVVVAIIIGIFFYYTRPVATATPAQTAAVTEAGQLAAPTDTNTALYRINAGDSLVGFWIDEVLHGSPFTAVGTTSQMTGDISVSTASGTPAVTVGTITIDARTFHTDSKERDGAINRLILHTTTAGNEYITFKTTSITGLPATITDGTSFTFSAVGDLTISGVTKPETLSITAAKNGDTLSGTMSADLKRADFNLVIPNFSFLANVSDSFKVSATFSAKKVQ